MSASFSDNFVVASLPRQALVGDSKDSKFRVSSSSATETYGKIHLGISGSFIASYIQKPTPKMVWTHAIAPQANVRALDVHTGQSTCFAVGITERNKSYVRLLVSDESSEEATSQIDIPTDSAAVQLKISSDGEALFCLFENGTTAVLPFSTSVKPEPKITGTSGLAQMVYHTYVDSDKVSEIQKGSDNVHGYFVAVGKESKRSTSYIVKMYALDGREILEILSTPLETVASKFIFNAPGTLVAINEKKKAIETYSLPFARHKKTIDVSSLVVKGITCVSVAPNRIVISSGNTVVLIDVLHEAVMAKHELSSAAKADFTTVELIGSALVKGNSQKTKDTYVLAVVKNSKENTAMLQNVKVNVGLGRLRDVLGNSTLRPTVESSFNGIPHVMKLVNGGSLVTEEKKNSEELAKFFTFLEKTKSSGDVESFDKAFVSFMKGTSPVQLMQNGNAKKQETTSRVYEVDHDRVVDHTFIHQVVSLLLGEPTGEPLDSDFVPIETLTYVLTHPLFPTDHARVVLKKLAPFPILTRQAVVTCPNVPCIELIHELSIIDNDDIFKDIIIRLTEEFSSEKITQETIQLTNTAAETEASFDLDRIVRKLVKQNFGFEILNSFIDSNGLILSLHYSSDAERLSNLLAKVDKQVDSLVSDSQLLTIVNKCIQAEDKKKKHSKKEDAVEEEQQIAPVVDQTRAKVGSMLPIGELTASHTLEELSKKVPVYSMERLTL